MLVSGVVSSVLMGFVVRESYHERKRKVMSRMGREHRPPFALAFSIARYSSELHFHFFV